MAAEAKATVAKLNVNQIWLAVRRQPSRAAIIPSTPPAAPMPAAIAEVFASMKTKKAAQSEAATKANAHSMKTKRKRSASEVMFMLSGSVIAHFVFFFL